MTDDLTPKQERFCQEYVIDLNGAAAAIRAGYSEQTARSIASELLTKPNIKHRVAELQAEKAKRLNLNEDVVIGMLLNTYHKATAEKQHGPAARCAELIGKHIRMFVDRLDVDPKGNTAPDWDGMADQLSGGDPALRAKIIENMPIPFHIRKRLRDQSAPDTPDDSDDTNEPSMRVVG